MRFWERLSRLDRWSILVTMTLGIIFVGAALSPSSYGQIAQFFHEDSGLVLGESRGVRADEWAVLTPLTQAAVRNGFTRYNTSSYWQEDMRMLYPLPIADWGMLFRPLMLPYLAVPPAYAFSFYYFSLLTLFVFGYSLLFRRLGVKPVHALLLSLILLCTGFTQYWWTMFAPTLAWFPWMLLAFASRLSPPLKGAVIAYLGACWLFGLFYPPLQYPLALVGLLLCIGFFRDRLRDRATLWWSLLGVAVAVALVGIYLREYLAANLQTVYPGHRTIGGGITPRLWLSQFFPLLNVFRNESLLPAINICETGMVGTFYALPALAFLRYGALRDPESRRRAFAGLWPIAAGFAAFSAWLLLPLPPWAGIPLQFHRIPPERLGFAAGFLLLFGVYLLADRLGLRLTWKRFAAYVVAYGAAFVLAAPSSGVTPLSLLGLWLMPIVIAAMVAFRARLGERTHCALLIAALVAGACGFLTFNPLQSARPIFASPDGAALHQQLRILQESEPNQTLVEPLFMGATLNGLGFRSFSHVLAVPPMSYWEAAFPEMTAAQRNEIFNRYAHVQVSNKMTDVELLWADLVGLPRDVARDVVARMPLPKAPAP